MDYLVSLRAIQAESIKQAHSLYSENICSCALSAHLT